MIPQFLIYVFFIIIAVVLYYNAAVSTRKTGIDGFLVADNSLSYSFIALSILVSWTWTLTIVGAAEAGMWYGISGGISYTVGATIPFCIFIPLVVRLKKLMPNAVAYTEFIGARYGELARNIYFFFAVLIVLYIFVEQLVGVALVFQNVFNFSFKVVVFIVAAIVTSFVARGGLKGTCRNNVLLFFAICLLFAAVFFSISQKFDVKFIYDGLLRASSNPGMENYNPQILMLNSVAGLKYGLIAIVAAFGQVLLNQGYYSLAMAANSKRSLVWGFLVGAIFAWMPIPIICANIFGHTALTLNLSPGHGINITTDIATYILLTYFGPILSATFSIMMLFIGITAGSNCLVGIQALYISDFYTNSINPDATDQEKIKFGRIITVCFGALCAFVAISLEGISLLKIDMFSGIFFAAPCSALIAGLYLRKTNGKVALFSIVAGILAGLSTWVYGNFNDSWLYGCLASFILPALIIMLFALFIKNRFNYAKLQFYRLKRS